MKSLLDAFPNLNFSSYASVETNILYDKVVIDFSSLYNDTLNILEKIKFNNLIVLLNPNIGLYEKLFSKYKNLKYVFWDQKLFKFFKESRNSSLKTSDILFEHYF